MFGFLRSIIDLLGKLIPGSGKKRKVETINASGSVWDKRPVPPKPKGDKPN